MNAKQEKAVAALLAGKSVKAAAIDAGISYSTIRRWLSEDEEFIDAHKQAQDEQRDVLRRKIIALGDGAIGTYAKALRGDNVKISAYRAAADILRTLGVIGEPDSASKAPEQDINIAFGTIAPDGTVV